MPEGRDEEKARSPQGRTAASRNVEDGSRRDRLVAALAEHFASHSIPAADWHRVASTTRDRFSWIDAETAIANIERVVRHFADDGLTTRHYLHGVIRQCQPQLFAKKPETIIGCVENVVGHFAYAGLTTREYLTAAVKRTQLLCQTPRTLIDNVESISDRFAADGLTTRDYLRAALKHPQLFGQKPETIIANIESVVRCCEADGLTTRDYLHAAVRQPPLFYLKPQTIIGHINLLAAMHENKLLPIPQGKPPLMDFITTHPALLTLADDNLHLREIATHIEGTADTTAPLHANRPDVEETVAHALRHRNGNASSEKVSHARRLLLNALKREGYLKER